MEFELKVDLTGDGVAGVSINSELFNKQQDASGNLVMNSGDRRWLYATSGGTLLSLNSLSVGGDLSSSNSGTMSSGSYDGPSFLLLKDSNGNDFSVPAGSSVLSLTVDREVDASGSNSAAGYTLLSQATNGDVTEFSFDLTGDLTGQSNLSDAEITALEVALLTDLNSDNTVGVTVNTKAYDKQYDASGNYINNTSDLRYLLSLIHISEPTRPY